MKSTADFVTDERPKNFRAGLLLLAPRNNAPLFSLTAAMGEEATDDPEFYWWEEDTPMYNFAVSGDVTLGATTIPLVNGGLMLKPGDMLRVGASGEAIRVATIVSDTSITVTRAVGPNGTPAGTAAAITAATNPKLMYVGSAYREGAGRSRGTSYNPVKRTNVTQIFRTPIEWTRTATATNYRTGDPRNNDRRRALHKHSLGIERAFWLGTKFETLEDGQPLRYTGGVMNHIPSSNVVTAGATTTLDQFEDMMAKMFEFGSKEKLVFGSLSTMILINKIIRKNTQYQWGPGEKEWSMDVKRLHTPAGTLVLTEHPLFGRDGDFLANDLVAMDTANLKYRYLRGADTKLLKDRAEKGVDGEAEEYLTEAGLEVHHGKTFFHIKGLTAAAKDA